MNKRKLKKAIRRVYYLPLSKSFPAYVMNKMNHFYLRITKATKVAYPSTIMLELTNHCNLACTICPREYEYGKDMDKGMMGMEQAKKIINEVYPYLDSIGLTGMGETFMYSELPEIVDYIKNKNKGIVISVSTNAVLPNFIDKVEKVINKIDTIQISIDGLNDVYNSIRKKSDFNILDKNIRLLSKMCKESSTDIMLNMVVTKENYMHMADLVIYAENCGINYLDFTLLNLASVTGIPNSYYDFYNSAEFLNAVADLETVMSDHRNVIVTNRNFKTDNGFINCPFPWTHFYISQDGYIPPCCAKPFPKEKNFGNINKDKLIDILNNKDFRDWRLLWYENKTPGFCQKCHFVNLKGAN
jgi:radical SAM protein with 4Fe4S-binding SPASM domain